VRAGMNRAESAARVGEIHRDAIDEPPRRRARASRTRTGSRRARSRGAEEVYETFVALEADSRAMLDEAE